MENENLGNITLPLFGKIERSNIGFNLEEKEESDELIQEILSLISKNKEKFEKSVIETCYNKISFDFTLGSDEEDDELFDEYIKPYLVQPLSREEYQEKMYNVGVENMEQELREIIDFQRFFENIQASLYISDDDFNIEISDDGLFSDPLVIVFDYEDNKISLSDIWD